MWKADAGAVVALGGDGTCRDVGDRVARGAADRDLDRHEQRLPDRRRRHDRRRRRQPRREPVRSTEPSVTAVAKARVAAGSTTRNRDTVLHEDALVEAALVDTTFVGARAVSDPTTIRWVVACIASPASTGLASIAGRVHPDRAASSTGGVLLRLGPGGRRLRVPLSPGTFSTLEVASVEPLAEGQQRRTDRRRGVGLRRRTQHPGVRPTPRSRRRSSSPDRT